MCHSHPGEVIASIWESFPAWFPAVMLGAWVLMPDHLHGIASIASTLSGEVHPEAPTLSGVVHWFKTQSTGAYGEGVRAHHWPRCERQLWQPGFTDRILRNDRELDQKRAYIEANPSRWQPDGQPWGEGLG